MRFANLALQMLCKMHGNQGHPECISNAFKFYKAKVD